MNREQFIKDLIKENGYTMKEFAQRIQMPYTTLRSILHNSIGGASVDNVIKICKGLCISVSTLQDFEEEPEPASFPVSDFEKNLVVSYRSQPNMQEAVNRILELDRKKWLG